MRQPRKYKKNLWIEQGKKINERSSILFRKFPEEYRKAVLYKLLNQAEIKL